MYNESVGWRLYLVSVVSPVFDEMRQAIGKLTMKHKIHILALTAAVAVSAQSAFAENLVIATNNGDMMRMQLTDDFSAKHPDIELENVEEQYANDITEVALGDGLTAGELTPSPLFQSISNFQVSGPENYSWSCRKAFGDRCLCDISGYENILFGETVCDKDSYFKKWYFSFEDIQNEYLLRIKSYLTTLEDVLKIAQIAEANILDFFNKTPVENIDCDDTEKHLKEKLEDFNNATLHFEKESAKAFYEVEGNFLSCLSSLDFLSSLVRNERITYESSVKEVEKKEGVSVDTTNLLLHFNKDNNPYPNHQRCPVRDIQFSKEQISNVRGEIEARHNNIKERHNEWVEGNSCGWTKDMTSLGKLP